MDVLKNLQYSSRAAEKMESSKSSGSRLFVTNVVESKDESDEVSSYLVCRLIGYWNTREVCIPSDLGVHLLVPSLLYIQFDLEFLEKL